MITVLLIKKILQLFLFTLLGYLLVRRGYAKGADSALLSKLNLYILFPGAVIYMFQEDFSRDAVIGFLYAFLTSLGCLLLFIAIAALVKRPCKLKTEESLQITYTNCGNLVIPLVLYILGPQWLLYTMPYNLAMNIFMFSHARTRFEKGELSLKGFFLQPTIICTLIGILFFVTGVKLPEVVTIPMEEMTSFLGPSAMIVLGMLLAETDLPPVLRQRNLWITILTRLLLCPLLVLAAFWGTGQLVHIPHFYQLTLIVYLSAVAPSANSITQFAQLYGGDEKYSGTLNILCTLCAIATMPLMVFLFETVM